MTGRTINFPDPTSCQGSHHILSVSVPSCRGFLNQLSSIMPFFLRSFVSFTTDPRVVGLVAGSAPVEQPHCLSIVYLSFSTLSINLVTTLIISHFYILLQCMHDIPSRKTYLGNLCFLKTTFQKRKT